MTSIIFDHKNPKVKSDSGKIYFTYDDLVKLPEWPEGPLIEILNGDLYMVPSPSILHQKISRKFTLLLGNYLEEHGIGELFVAPTDVVLSPENTVIPDLFFINNTKKDIIKEKKIEGTPDLIVEITSINRKRDLVDKLELYEEFGVSEYIIVDIDNSVLLHNRLVDGSYESNEVTQNKSINFDQLPGLNILISEIFEI